MDVLGEAEWIDEAPGQFKGSIQATAAFRACN